MKSSLLYAHRRIWPALNEHRQPHPLAGQPMYADIMSHYRGTKTYGDGPIYQILVREPVGDETPYYWAWWNKEDQQFQFVFGARLLVEVCFPYGTKVETDLGRGQVCQVIIEEVGLYQPQA